MLIMTGDTGEIITLVVRSTECFVKLLMVFNKSSTSRNFILVSPDMTSTAQLHLLHNHHLVDLGEFVTPDMITSRAMTRFTSDPRLCPCSYKTFSAVLMTFFLVTGCVATAAVVWLFLTLVVKRPAAIFNVELCF
jgi:hypothetical protein